MREILNNINKYFKIAEIITLEISYTPYKYILNLISKALNNYFINIELVSDMGRCILLTSHEINKVLVAIEKIREIE
jgi:predicted transcriptional regulator